MGKIIGAVVERIDTQATVVRTGKGIADIMNLKGINRPGGVHVGDIGILEYKTTRTTGLWWFKSNRSLSKPEES